ncbi:unnamed protein product [Linum tenue]|uniref:Uncharacterized protein n=1 Tax=Linum tenue TaxID=586396 RepID=A0AAV0KJB5_9ROSI|nr:unnamed protein product [Linum tenue]
MIGIPSSKKTHQQASSLGIPLFRISTLIPPSTSQSTAPTRSTRSQSSERPRAYD